MKHSVKIKVPYRLFNEALEDGEVKDFAVYLGLKHTFVSGHIHSTSNRSLSDLPVCGRAKARETIKKYHKRGYIRQEAKGYSFLSYKNILGKDTYQYFIISVSSTNHKEIYKALFERYILGKKKKQEYVSTVTHHLTNPETLRQFKSAKKRRKRLDNYIDGWIKRDGDLNLSFQRMASEFNISVSSAFNLVEGLIRRGRIMKQNNFVQTTIPNILLSEARESSSNIYIKGKGGYLKQVLPNSYYMFQG